MISELMVKFAVFALAIGGVSHLASDFLHDITNPTVANAYSPPDIAPPPPTLTRQPSFYSASSCTIAESTDQIIFQYSPGQSVKIGSHYYEVLAALTMNQDVDEAYYTYKRGDQVCILRGPNGTIFRFSFRGQEVLTEGGRVFSMQKDDKGQYYWIDSEDSTKDETAAVIYRYNPKTNQLTAEVRKGVSASRKINHPPTLSPNKPRVINTSTSTPPPSPTPKPSSTPSTSDPGSGQSIGIDIDGRIIGFGCLAGILFPTILLIARHKLSQAKARREEKKRLIGIEQKKQQALEQAQRDYALLHRTWWKNPERNNALMENLVGQYGEKVKSGVFTK